MIRAFCLVVLTSLAACSSGVKKADTTTQAPAALEQSAGFWQPWSDALFAQAKKEGRPVLLDLEAIWCHWCHVMDESTYRDPRVVKLLTEKFLAVKVDQDSRPDLSNRYEDYGWPATIIFSPDGQEIVKRAGNIPPDDMVKLLEAVAKNPTPGPSAQAEKMPTGSVNGALSDAARQALKQRYLERYDFKAGAWGFGHKFLDADSVEYAMTLAQGGDTQTKSMAEQTLEQQLHLLDPAWGGVYQYSTGGNWNEPHFEKIMSVQAENLRIYALAYALWQNPKHLQAAEQIANYLQIFLTSAEGAFYTSQDADLVAGEHSADYFAKSDAERRKVGVPRVDPHRYARENGWAINALAVLYGVTGNELYLKRAKQAADWIVKNRSLPDGGFRHDEQDASGPYLGDTLAMGHALATLYLVTGERPLLAQAEATAQFIDKKFPGLPPSNSGFVTVVPHPPTPQPLPQRDENILMARFANQLFHFTGNTAYQKMAQRALGFLASPESIQNGFAGGILLTDLELSQPPLHITVVGHKDDPKARQLFQAALRYPAFYRRIEWLDKRDGVLPNKDVDYPELPTAAAFICSNRICSSPIFQPEQVAERIVRLKQNH